jgi:hypothetical protein
VIPCPHCSCHVRRSDTTCPHCDARIGGRAGASPTTAVLALGLFSLLPGCPGKMNVDYGTSPTSDTETTPTETGVTETGDTGP